MRISLNKGDRIEWDGSDRFFVAPDDGIFDIGVPSTGITVVSVTGRKTHVKQDPPGWIDEPKTLKEQRTDTWQGGYNDREPAGD